MSRKGLQRMNLYPGMKPNIPNEESFVSELQVGLISFSKGSCPSPPPSQGLHSLSAPWDVI